MTTTKPVSNQNTPSPLAAPLTGPRSAEINKPKDAKAVAANAGANLGGNAASKSDVKAANVNISTDGKGRAEAMQKAFDIAKATPDVREDRVAELKKQIDAGTYQVDSAKIADGMLREAIKDHLAESGER